MSDIDHGKRIQLLRCSMQEHEVEALLLVRDNEYLYEYDHRLYWLTGFSGSNGLVIVTQSNKCPFFTDSRYILQAQQELMHSLYDIYDLEDYKPWQWVNTRITTLSYDAKAHTQTQINKYTCCQGLLHNPFEKLWQKSSTAVKQTISIHEQQYAGKSSMEKCREIACNLTEPFLFTKPSSICWLLNIRGNGDKYIPLVFCYALLYPNGMVELFIQGKSNIVLEEHITVYDIDSLNIRLVRLENLGIDFRSTSLSILQPILHKVENKEDPCILPKARKNIIEIAGAKSSHIKDGIALSNFLFWLYENIDKQCITEFTAAEQLEEFRKQQPLFQSLSFTTISAFNSNGAIIHYSPKKDQAQQITGNGLYLFDSGAQYLHGTTDVTRTIAIGNPTLEQKHAYTLVLQGHIALAIAIFPNSTCGAQLDILARLPLWQNSLNYKHATGHGVASYLEVHEGPQAINQYNHIPLQPGMIVSNEPGYYRENEYGIRLENLMYVVKKDDDFLRFQVLTCVPIDTRLIIKSLLTTREIQWVNAYNKMVLQKLQQYLDYKIITWLQRVYCPTV